MLGLAQYLSNALSSVYRPGFCLLHLEEIIYKVNAAIRQAPHFISKQDIRAGSFLQNIYNRNKERALAKSREDLPSV